MNDARINLTNAPINLDAERDHQRIASAAEAAVRIAADLTFRNGWIDAATFDRAIDRSRYLAHCYDDGQIDLTVPTASGDYDWTLSHPALRKRLKGDTGYRDLRIVLEILYCIAETVMTALDAHTDERARLIELEINELERDALERGLIPALA